MDTCCPRLHDQGRPQPPSALVLMCGSILQFLSRVRSAGSLSSRFGDLGARRARAAARQACSGGVYRWSYECSKKLSRGGSPHRRATAAGRAYETRAPSVPCGPELTAQEGSISRAGFSERVCRAPLSATRGEERYTCEWICLSTECLEQAPGREDVVYCKNSREHLGAPIC